MEIPHNVLDKLKCSKCDELLSCGPVYLLHATGAAICGRCSQHSKTPTERTSRTRNTVYEAAASLLEFPCAHAAHGCREKLPFSRGVPSHETNCEFRPLKCPFDSCQWTQPWLKLKEHCATKHPEHFHENPCHLPQPNLTSTNLRAYVISAFRFLFLLHVKVCLATGKLYHSVWMFGDQKHLDTFFFNLEIEGDGLKHRKAGSVLRAGISCIEGPASICTALDYLSGISGGNSLKYTLRIQTLFKYCVNCLKQLENGFASSFCPECEGKLLKCDFHDKGCLFADIHVEKCRKHKQYFCEYQTKCLCCGVNISGGSLIEHLGSATSCRKTTKANIDAVVRLTPNSNCNYILFTSRCIGTIICEYYLSNSNFQLLLRASLPSYDLNHFKCFVELIDPRTKHALILTPKPQFNNNYYDWYVYKDMCNFLSCKNTGIDIKINIDKI